MRRLVPILVAAGLCWTMAGSARAMDTRRPVQFRLLGEPLAAVAGQPYEGTIAIEAREATRIRGLRLDGRGWKLTALEAPDGLALARGGIARVRFVAIPSDPIGSLVLRCETDAGEVTWGIDLSPRAFERVARLTRLAERAAAARPVSTAREAGPAAVQRAITVRGRIHYTRIDGVDVGADMVRVRVYHESAIGWQILGQGETDYLGDFSIDTVWNGGSNPNLFVEYTATNDHVTVYTPFVGGFPPPYSWTSATRQNEAAADVDFGDLAPPDEDDFPALHILTTLVRGWKWLDRHDYTPSSVNVEWPQPGSINSYWSDGWIHIPGIVDPDEPNTQQWSEATQLHEYGHHWVHQWGSVSDSRNYCNGYCDMPGQCRHCDWCEETEWDAWNEGFADWMGDVIARSFATDFLQPAYSTRDHESLQPCIQSGSTWNPDYGEPCPCDPWKTEGPWSAVLRDIEDPNPIPAENDLFSPGSWRDVLARGEDPILQVASDPWNGHSGPQSPEEFLDAYQVAFGTKQQRRDLWETAKNNTYDMDHTPPLLPSGLISPSHNWTRFDPGSTSDDATVDYTWNAPDDDASGIAGYSYVLSANDDVLPDQILDLFGDLTGFTTGALAPGEYWLHLRPVDRAGRWAASKVSYGPVRIRERTLSDLEPYLYAGWAAEVVPRSASNASAASCPAPATLPGGGNTWWNATGKNVGDDPVAPTTKTYAYVDGLFRMTTDIAPIGSRTTFYTINRGPLAVSGGRHTFAAGHDATELVHESDETDNLWGRQWIWEPLALAAGARLARPLPPDRNGGWDMVVDGSVLWYDCDGLGFTTAAPWNAVWVHSGSDNDDYDCRLHAASTGATNGFASNLGWGSRPAGCLDAVIVNRNVTGNGSYDVGVIDFNPTHDPLGASYLTEYVTSTSLAFESSVAVSLPQDEMLVLKEFSVPAASQGLVSITVKLDDPKLGPVHVAYLDETFTTGDLLDAAASGVTDAAGHCRLDLDIVNGGWRCVAIYRDPKDGRGPITMTLEVAKTRPDFEPVALAGWHSPMVPRPANDGVPASVPAPATLVGNAAATWFNYAVENASPAAAASGMISRLHLDGVAMFPLTWSSFGANATRTFHSSIPRTVRGGRHTAAVRYDDDLAIAELDEDDNGWGEQWVWSPLALAAGATMTRAAPPDRTGGWSEITVPASLWYDCDGLRTPVFAPSGSDGFWGAAAVMPGAASDEDVRLHETNDSVKGGFRSNLVSSAWGTGQSDFVLVNFNQTPFRAFDVGVLLGSGGEDYAVEVATSIYRVGYPNGDFGPFTLPADRLLDLHEFTLDGGTYTIRLENVSGTVDWGFTVHSGATAYHEKSGGLPGGTAWLAGAGQDEQIELIVPADGYHCVAVWKAGAADRALEGSYRLHLTKSMVSVTPGATPASLDFLAAPQPNPCRARTGIGFGLATEQDARLEVFDLRGARVRTLTSGRVAAGVHRAVWDGQDDGGRPVGAGIYLVRLETGRTRKTVRLVKLE